MGNQATVWFHSRASHMLADVTERAHMLAREIVPGTCGIVKAGVAMKRIILSWPASMVRARNSLFLMSKHEPGISP